MRKLLSRDYKRILAFLLPVIVGFLIYYPEVLAPSLTSDGRLYLSIADNFLSTGHFTQTTREEAYVVPFAYPLYLTILRFFRMPVTGFVILNYISLGVSSVFLYDTERKVFGNGGIASLVYTYVFYFNNISPRNLYIEFFYLFMLCWLQWLYFRDELPPGKRLLLMNVAGFIAFAARPVLAPVYVAVLLYTLWQWRKKLLSIKRLAVLLLTPVLIFALNTAVNYREVGYIVPICNYTNDSLCFSLNPLSDPNTSELNYTPENTVSAVRELYEDMTIPKTVKNAAFKEMARGFVRDNPRHVLFVASRHVQSVFFYSARGLMALAIVGFGFLLSALRMRSRRRFFVVQGLLIAILIFTTAFGISERRYAMPIWPMAALQVAAIPRLTIAMLREHYPEEAEDSPYVFFFRWSLRRWREWACFLLPVAVFLGRYCLTGTWYDTDSETDRFFSVAYNFINFGHFSSPALPGESLVLPFGFPLLLTFLNAVGFSIRMVVFAQYFMLGGACLLLYSAERRIFGRGGISPVLFCGCFALARVDMSATAPAPFYMLGLCACVYVSLRADIPLRRRYTMLFVFSFFCAAICPVLLPIFVAVLLLTVKATLNNAFPIRRQVVLVLAALVVGINTWVNFRESGNPVVLSHYAGHDSFSQNETHMPPREGQPHPAGETPMTQEEAAKWVKENPGQYLRRVGKFLWRNFFAVWHYAPVVMLLCAGHLFYAYPRRRRWVTLWLGAGLAVAVFGSLGMVPVGFLITQGHLAGLYLAAPVWSLVNTVKRRVGQKKLPASER